MIEGHGDDLYRYQHRITANFSSNLTNWIDSAPLADWLRSNLNRMICSYPEPCPYTLESNLARMLGILPANICVTAGATDAIYLVARSFTGCSSAILQPTFSEYSDACRINGHRCISIYRLPNDGKLADNIQMMWICNPNNPTGTVIKKDTLINLIHSNPNVIFIIDQSYEDFTLSPLFTPTEAIEHPNVLLLHSMTKRYSMPGLRLGYITGNDSLLRHLQIQRMPWAVNGVALAAGLFLTGHPNAVTFDLHECLKETARLKTALQSAGSVEVWETETHFMLARLRIGRAAALKEYLAKEHGILIRDASNFNGLDASFFRVSTQRPADNERLVRAICQWSEI